MHDANLIFSQMKCTLCHKVTDAIVTLEPGFVIFPIVKNFVSNPRMLLLFALTISFTLNIVIGQQDQPNIVFILADDLGIK